MTIKSWNSLPQTKKEAVANILGDIDKLDTESTKKLATNYISAKNKLTILQKMLLEVTKLLPNGDVEINIKIVV